MKSEKKDISSIISVAVVINAVFGMMYVLLAIATIFVQMRAMNFFNGGYRPVESSAEGGLVILWLFTLSISPITIMIAVVGIIVGLASIRHASRWFSGHNVSDFGGRFSSVCMLLIGVGIISTGPAMACVGLIQCTCSIISIYGMIMCPFKTGSKNAGKIVSMNVEEDPDNAEKKDLPPMLNAEPDQSMKVHDIFEKK